MKLAGSRVGLACALVLATLAASLLASQLRSSSEAARPAPVPGQVSNSPLTALPVSNAQSSLWDKRWWLDKTARLLRAGEGLGPDDDIGALLDMSEEEVARHFMKDSRFGDAILDFNMFFLGFKANDLKSDGVYNSHAFDFSNAVASTQALLAGGDYFKLFDLEGDLYMAPLRAEPPEEDLPREDQGLSADKLRRKAVGEMQTVLDDLASAAQATVASNGDARELCGKLNAVVARRSDLAERVHRAFDDAEIFILTRAQVVSWPLDTLEKAAKMECGRVKAEPDLKQIEVVAASAASKFRLAFDEIFRFSPDGYEPQTVGDFKRFDLTALPTREKWLAFGFEQAVALQNSSTNFNRKRSAYVLKRFFCDDLTPVGFEDPQEHVAGAHGSETSCYACHYKLDPMAGFFRSLGAQLYDYSRERIIIFDDLADDSRAKYAANWRARKGADRTWDVGYVRSPRWENQNSYGETLGDLSKIIRSAPEARRCLMKRLFEYMTAETQTVDGSYLDYLTETFEAEAAINSSTAMQNAILRVLRSRTYHERNPEAQRCYDRAPGAAAGDGPPCRVAYILQKNCAQCHSTVYGGDANLDLGGWIVSPDGKNHTFPHLDNDMQQKAAGETITRVMERLSSSDPKTRMPKNKIMSSQERQELFLWAQQELSRIGGGTP